MLGARCIRGDVRQVDFGLHRAGQLDLGLFGGFLEALQGLAIFAQVNAILAHELIRQVINQALVEIIAAQEGVAAGGTHLENAFAYIQHRYIEGAPAQVIHGDHFVLLLVQPISQR